MLLTLVLALIGFIPQSDPLTPLVAETRTFIEGLMAGRTAPVFARFDERMASALSEAQLAQAVTTVKQQAGEYRSITATQTQVRGNVRAVVATCDFVNGPVDVVVAYDEGGRIVGLNMRPSAAAPQSEYKAPDYVTADRFTESEVTVGAPGWPLPGTLTLPTMLVLQGERDYQVTMTDFAAWRTALAGRKDTRLISYPTLNHLFMAGEGPGNPAEYRRPGHVDAGVIRDIQQWIAER